MNKRCADSYTFFSGTHHIIALNEFSSERKDFTLKPQFTTLPYFILLRKNLFWRWDSNPCQFRRKYHSARALALSAIWLTRKRRS